jgi:hypothetical protein
MDEACVLCIGVERHQTISVLASVQGFLPIPSRINGNRAFEPEV